MEAFDDYMRRENTPVSLLELLRESRLVLLAFHVAILTLSYLYARRLLGLIPALAGFMLIAFDPFYLGLTRLLHLDGLMTSTILLSLLAFLVYLSERRLPDLLISGIAAGLGWLTKSPAVLIVPVVGLLAIRELGLAFRKRELTVRLVWRFLGR